MLGRQRFRWRGEALGRLRYFPKDLAGGKVVPPSRDQIERAVPKAGYLIVCNCFLGF